VSFIRTRTIKNQKYRYLETRWREGGKVRSKSVYLGASWRDSPVTDCGKGQDGYDHLPNGAALAKEAPPPPAALAAPADSGKETPAEAGAKAGAEEGVAAPSDGSTPSSS